MSQKDNSLHEFCNLYPSFSSFCIASIASFVGETVTYPLDMIKTRKQIYGELQSSTKIPSSISIFVNVIKKEGFFTLFNGLSPALFRHLFYTGIRMPLYEYIRYQSLADQNSNFIEYKSCQEVCSPDGPESLEKLAGTRKFGIIEAAIAGIISGAVAQFVCTPTDLLKVQLQAAKRSLNNEHSKPSFYKLTNNIIRERGLKGLWRGALPNTQRAALVNMGEMTTYDTAKHWMMNNFNISDGPLLQFLSSALSGFVSSCLGTPTDLIKTRMMRQLPTEIDLTAKQLSEIELMAIKQQMQYTGMIDCAVKIVRNEGIFSLYRGFFLIWARMAPWSLTFWLSYEQMRSFCGLNGF